MISVVCNADRKVLNWWNEVTGSIYIGVSSIPVLSSLEERSRMNIDADPKLLYLHM